MPNINLGPYVTDVVNWLVNNLGGLFNAISSVVSSIVTALTNVLTAPPPLVMVGILALIALVVAHRGVVVFTILAFLLIDGMQLWNVTMQTLAIVLVASVIATVVAIPVGIWSARSRTVNLTTRPVLDLMQTLPAYVYLLPAVFFFGVGLVPAVVATAVFAVPPAVRLTDLGIRQVDQELVEAAHAFGARPSQILREIQLPLALPSIMAGINQVIMLALSMVVIAGLVGAGGLGTNVVAAVTQLNIGAGFEAGLGVVILAVYLDRVSASVGGLPSRLRSWRLRERLARRHGARDLPTDVRAAL